MSSRSTVASPVRAFQQYRDGIARRTTPRVRSGECPTCLGPHEEEIHSATIRIHRWFRTEVTRGFVRPPAAQ